jgi:hypothetical protein
VAFFVSLATISSLRWCYPSDATYMWRGSLLREFLRATSLRDAFLQAYLGLQYWPYSSIHYVIELIARQQQTPSNNHDSKICLQNLRTIATSRFSYILHSYSLLYILRKYYVLCHTTYEELLTLRLICSYYGCYLKLKVSFLTVHSLVDVAAFNFSLLTANSRF